MVRRIWILVTLRASRVQGLKALEIPKARNKKIKDRPVAKHLVPSTQSTFTCK